jgi:hypothetical protein
MFIGLLSVVRNQQKSAIAWWMALDDFWISLIHKNLSA